MSDSRLHLATWRWVPGVAIVLLVSALATPARPQSAPDETTAATAPDVVEKTGEAAQDDAAPAAEPAAAEPAAADSATDPGAAPASTVPPAAAPPASLLAPTNAPQLASVPALSPAPSDLQLSVIELTSGVTAAAIAVPATLALATGLGSLPSNLLLAVLPALLLTAALPPLAVVGAEWALAEWVAPGRETPWWALGATAIAQLGIMTTAVLAGVSTRQLPGVLVLGAVEVVVLPAIATAVLRATRCGAEPPEPPVATGPGGAP